MSTSMMDPVSEYGSEMPDSSSRYHSEYLLEAQELQHQPFKSSGLGRLPAEVRNLIYAFVMAFESSKKDRSPYWLMNHHQSGSLRATLPSSAGSPQRGTKPRIALLCICRQIYQEARTLYYSSDYFCFTKAESMLGLLFEAGWAHRSDLQLVLIFLGGRICNRLQSYEEAKALWETLGHLVHCKYLQKLKIFIGADWHHGPNLLSDFILPFREIENIEIVVNSYRPRGWDYWDEDEIRKEEAHQWRLVRSNVGACFEVDDGNADDKDSIFWSQRAVQIVPRLQVRPPLRRILLRW